MDDADEVRRLVAAARTRDRAAIASLFDRYYDAVYRYAFARLGTVSDAEDAAAETFVSMVRALPRFRWRGVPFEAWLFRIAMSKVVDVARHRTRVRVGGELDPELSDVEADPARVFSRLEAGRELVRAMEQLPADQRDGLATERLCATQAGGPQTRYAVYAVRGRSAVGGRGR